jgi:large repetitive protein
VTFAFADSASGVNPTVGFTYSFDCNSDGTFEVVDSSSTSANCPAGTQRVTGRITENGIGTRDFTTTVAADISLTKTDSPDPVKKGRPLTYTLTVSNGGPLAASGVTATDPLPAKVELRSAKASQGTCSSAKPKGGTITVSCALGEIASGSTAAITIVVKPMATGTLTNTAVANAASPTDPNPANNTATATSLVTG